MVQNTGSYELEQYVNPNPVMSVGGVDIIDDTTPEGDQGRIMRIQPGSGFGSYGKTIEQVKPFFMRVNDGLDYEVSFWFKQPTAQPSISLSVDAYSCYDYPKPIYESTNGAQENHFILDGERVISNEDTWYFARYILFGFNKTIEPLQQPITSLAAGRNLIMSEGTTNIIVSLYSNFAELKIWNFKVKPLRTDFSTGFIQGGGMLEIFRKNNNNGLTDDQLDNVADNLLLPYNTANIHIKLK